MNPLASTVRSAARLVYLTVILLGLATTALAQDEIEIELTKIYSVPKNIESAERSILQKRYESLKAEREPVKSEVLQINSSSPVEKSSSAYTQRRERLQELATVGQRLSAKIKTFNADVAIASSPESWIGQWLPDERQKTATIFQAIADPACRTWLERRAPKGRVAGTPSGLPGGPSASDLISANDGVLRIKTPFFDPRISDPERENLVAFEAGKVFWTVHANTKVNGDQTLEKWFTEFSEHNRDLISKLKATPYNGYHLEALGDLADPQSEFGHVFRGQAFGLIDKKGQTQAEAFQKRILPLLLR